MKPTRYGEAATGYISWNTLGAVSELKELWLLVGDRSCSRAVGTRRLSTALVAFRLEVQKKGPS